MAQVLSGSFNTTAYSNRYLTFSWSATQNIAANQTTISWSLKGAGSYTGYYRAAPFTVTIAGTVVYSDSNRINLYSGTTVASGTHTITHNTDGTQSFSASVTAAIFSYGVNCSGSGTWELPTIPRLATMVSAPNFTDEDNPTITYSNPAGTSVKELMVGIFDANSDRVLVDYREVSTTGTTYTFYFTEAERNSLRGHIPNSNSATVTFYIRTLGADDVYRYSPLQKTFTIAFANPTLAPVLMDARSNVLAITGNNKCIVRHKSYLYAKANSQAVKGTTLKRTTITSGSFSVNLGETNIPNPVSSVVTFSTEDNRGNTVTQSIDLADNDLGYTWIPYIEPTCSMSVSLALDSSTTSKATITAEGDYYNSTIGATANRLTVGYSVFEEGVEEALYDADFTEVNISGNRYSATIELDGLDYQKTYTFMCYCSDVFNGMTVSDDISLSTLPIFDWSKTDFNFNVPVSFEGSTMVDMVIEQGTAAMGSNGTWYWRKWKSGRAECCGSRNYGNMGVSTPWGSLYESSTFTQSLPTGLFVDVPSYCSIEFLRGNANAWIAKGFNNDMSSTSTGSFNVVRPVAGTISQAYLGFNVIGRWK